MARRGLTDQQRQDQRTEALAKLEHATEALLSTDGWRGWLRTRSVLHGYSANNTLLLWAQTQERDMPLTHVAGFKAWLRLGRCVRKGERGLKVFAPMPIPKRKEKEAKAQPTGSHSREEERPRMRFRLSSVFEVSQTEPLPDVKPAPLEAPRQPVEGDSHAHLLAPLEAFANEIGYPVERVQDLGGPEAHCHHGEKAIRLVDAFPANHQVAALIHELAHALQGPRPRAEYARNEVIVESTAFIVTQAAGLDSSPSAVPYISDWGGNDAMANVRAAVSEIDVLASRLQTVVEQVDQDDEQETDRQAPEAPGTALQAA